MLIRFLIFSVGVSKQSAYRVLPVDVGVVVGMDVVFYLKANVDANVNIDIDILC